MVKISIITIILFMYNISKEQYSLSLGRFIIVFKEYADKQKIDENTSQKITSFNK